MLSLLLFFMSTKTGNLKVIKPVLAGAAKPKRGPKPKDLSPLDRLYAAIQAAMRDLLLELGVAI
jgi:hypothetical protein